MGDTPAVQLPNDRSRRHKGENNGTTVHQVCLLDTKVLWLQTLHSVVEFQVPQHASL